MGPRSDSKGEGGRRGWKYFDEWELKIGDVVKNEYIVTIV
jgi:hypothetical protein